MFGAGFLFIEIHEFVGMIDQGAGPSRSAFLSAFFTLVGCHGLHVTLGLLWLLTMVAQVFAKGYRADILRRVLCFAPLLAHARHHLGRDLHRGLSLGSRRMSQYRPRDCISITAHDHAPGDEPATGHEIAEGLLGYLVGLFLAALHHRRRILHRRDRPGLAA